MSDSIVFSDGGGDRSAGGAGACIVRAFNVERCGAIFLGGATNNEAEISGALLGFTMLHTLSEGELPNRHRVRWVADSEYALKGRLQYSHSWQKNGWKTASKGPVKNRTLWEVFLHLSRTLAIDGTHVRGHSGHPENEACDEAAERVRLEGELFFSNYLSHLTIELSEGTWDIFDGRDFIEKVRERDEAPQGSVTHLAEEFLALVVSAGASGTVRSRPAKASIDPLLHAFRMKLRTLQKELSRISSKMKGGSELEQAISRFLQENDSD